MSSTKAIADDFTAMCKAGQRMQMSETALYTVANGKIVEERFFTTSSFKDDF